MSRRLRAWTPKEIDRFVRQIKKSGKRHYIPAHLASHIRSLKMPQTNHSATISALRAQMNRAKDSGLTDEELAQAQAAQRIRLAIEDAAGKEHTSVGGRLTTDLVLAAIAIELGGLIKENRLEGPFSGAILASEYMQLIFNIATQD